MFSPKIFKGATFAAIALSAVALSACGKTPASTATMPAQSAQIVEAQRSIKIDLNWIKNDIRRQLETSVSYTYMRVKIYDLQVWPMAEIMIYPPRLHQMYEFKAIRSVAEKFGDPRSTQWFKIRGTYSLKTGKVVVTESEVTFPVVYYKN